MFYLFAPKVKDGKPLVEIPKKGDFYRDDIGCPVKMMDYECRVYMPILEMKTFEQDPFRHIKNVYRALKPIIERWGNEQNSDSPFEDMT